MWGIAVDGAMKPVNHDLILIQDEIRESFDWTLESDYESATSLVAQWVRGHVHDTIRRARGTVVQGATRAGLVPLRVRSTPL